MAKILIALCIVIITCTAGAVSAEELKLNSNHEYTINDFKLSDSDLLWLTRKKQIVVGLYEPMDAPLSFIEHSGKLSGIDAEYIALLKNSLHTDVTIRTFSSEEEADSALKRGDIDLVINRFHISSGPDKDIVYSRPFLYAYPALISKRENAMASLKDRENFSVAVASDYPSASFIKSHFKDAVIHPFATTEMALASVERGESDFFMGNNLESDYYLSNDYYHDLSQIKIWPEQVLTQAFAIKRDNDRLTALVNRFVAAISHKTHNQLIESWVDSESLPIFDGPVDLTRQEQAWIHNSPPLRVIVNPYNFPFSMTDSDHQLRGLAGDLLNLITLKTGLSFTPVYANSNNETKKIIESGQWDLHPAATYSPDRSRKVIFSNPWLSTPFVIVLKENQTDLREMTEKMSVAIPANHAIQSFIKENFKNVKITEAVNSSDAIKMMQDGKVDAAISTKLTAQFYAAHYESDDIIFYPIRHAPVAEIRFAIPNGDNTLQVIINKVIADIPPKQMRRLTHKWTDIPTINVDTWNIYKSEFYQVIAFALILIVSSLFWGFYLLRETKKRKKSELDLKDQLNFSSTLSSSVPYPLYVITTEGELINNNPAFNAFFSSAEKVGSRNLLSEVGHPLHPVFDAMHTAMTSSDINNNVITLTTRMSNGSEFRDTMHWFTTFKTTEGHIPLLICGWSDITEHNMLLEALKRESDNAILSKKSKGEFLAMMSHELRTPLSAILGFLELIRLDHPDDENIELAFSTGTTLLGLIGEVLDVEKIESGHYAINEEWMDINTLLGTIVSMFDALASQKQLNITLRSSINDGLQLWSDPQAIRQILSNLIGNAIKFTDHGDIFVDAEISLFNGNDARLKINIQDNGKGIAQEEQDKLFKLFSQTTTGQNSTGSGLGLFICNQIVKILNGSIYLSESSPRGSTFSVDIPVKMSAIKKTLPVISPALPSPDSEAELRILIADDNLTNRLLLVKQLSSLGYSADEVPDGEQAFHALQLKHYDLLITDINMPVLNGIELTQKVRAYNQTLIIWGLTAYARTDEKEQCLNSGMQLLLFKPMKLDDLSSLLQSITSHGQGNVIETIIDMESLSALAMGSSDIIVQMLEHSRQECRKDLNEIVIAQKTMDRDIIDRFVHRIAGTAQILGSTVIVKLCEEIERGINERESDTFLQEQIRLLILHMSSFFTSIDNFLLRKEKY